DCRVRADRQGKDPDCRESKSRTPPERSEAVPEILSEVLGPYLSTLAPSGCVIDGNDFAPYRFYIAKAADRFRPGLVSRHPSRLEITRPHLQVVTHLVLDVRRRIGSQEA